MSPYPDDPGDEVEARGFHNTEAQAEAEYGRGSGAMKTVADIEAEAIAQLVPDPPLHPAFGYRSGSVRSPIATRNRLKYVDDGETWRDELGLPHPVCFPEDD